MKTLDAIASSSTPAIQLVSSKQDGEAISRQSLRSLYALAYALHRPHNVVSSSAGSALLDHREVETSRSSTAPREARSRGRDGPAPVAADSRRGATPSVVVWSALPYHVPTMETSLTKHVTSSQIGGQLNVLMRPILRRLQDRVREAQRLFGDRGRKHATDGGGGGSEAEGRPEGEVPSSTALSSSFEEEEEEEGGTRSTPPTRPKSALMSSMLHMSDSEEEKLDAEIERLLALQEKRKTKGKSSHKGDALPSSSVPPAGASREKANEKEKDAWRYAFGKGNPADEEDEEDEEGNEEEDGRKEEAEAEDTHGKRKKPRRRGNAEEEEEDGDDALAALKEMYGEDYEEADGSGFLDDEEEEIDASDEEREKGEGEEGPGSFFYKEEDGKYFGEEDILADGDDETFGSGDGKETIGDGGVPQGNRGVPASSSSSATLSEEELQVELGKDEELQQYLQRTDVSDFQKELAVERKKIALLEQRRLYGIHQWSMTGEVNVSKRPRDALLEMDQLDFEYGMKSVPVITEAVSKQLEERIKDRILKSLFDDVVRRRDLQKVGGSPEDLAALMARRKSEEEKKSSLSLMDLYEKDFAEKQRRAEEGGPGGEDPSATPLTAIERDELRAIQMWKRLAQHLDALSNFYFTPKPVHEDMEARVRAVEGQAPALLMESVGAFAASRETALAPQDVYRPKADGGNLLTGSAERLPSERKARRRHKKEVFGLKKKIVEQNKVALQREQKKAKESAAAKVTEKGKK